MGESRDSDELRGKQDAIRQTSVLPKFPTLLRLPAGSGGIRIVTKPDADIAAGVRCALQTMDKSFCPHIEW